VNLDQIVESVVRDTLGPHGSLWAFRPELTLCLTIVAILLARTVFPRWKTSGFYVTLLGLCATIYVALPWRWLADAIPVASQIFTGTLVNDSFTVVMRGLLLMFAILFTTFTQITGVTNNQEDATEFYALMLGALLGMCLMISANHILIVLLGVEMASVPCYVLAGMQKNRPKASEAALKYAVFGAGAAGIMLYGLSLLAGVLGSAHLPTMTARLVELIQTGAVADRSMVLVRWRRRRRLSDCWSGSPRVSPSARTPSR
jgi:NADH-quinone oxidoreductase subunit N